MSRRSSFSSLTLELTCSPLLSDIEIVPGVEAFTLDADALAEAYGKASFTSLFSSPFLVLCTTAAAMYVALAVVSFRARPDHDLLCLHEEGVFFLALTRVSLHVVSLSLERKQTH